MTAGEASRRRQPNRAARVILTRGSLPHRQPPTAAPATADKTHEATLPHASAPTTDAVAINVAVEALTKADATVATITTVADATVATSTAQAAQGATSTTSTPSRAATVRVATPPGKPTAATASNTNAVPTAAASPSRAATVRVATPPPGKPTAATASTSTLPEDQGKRTWTSLFAPQATTSNRVKLHHLPPTRDGDKFRITATTEELAEAKDYWQNTLVGHFIGSRPPYHIVKARVEAMWKPTGGMEILTLSAGFYIFRFTLVEDRNRILEGGPWFILNRILLLKPWDQNTRLQKIDLSTVPVWIKIHNLPMSLWSPTLISKIASCAGVPLHMDQATAARTRITYARVCVEVSAEQQLPNQISFTVNDEQDYILQLEYDRKPPQCNKCCIFGHTDANCPLQQAKEKPIWRPKPTTQTTQATQPPPNSTAPITTRAEVSIRTTPAQSPAKHSNTHSAQKQAETQQEEAVTSANPAAKSKEPPSSETTRQKGKQVLPQGNQAITVNNRFQFLANAIDNGEQDSIAEQDPTDPAGPSTVERYKPPDPPY